MSAPDLTASTTAYLVIAGQAVVIGKSPDGDSVRFRPDDPALLALLDFGQRVHPSADGTVQLRFDGVDAPELHYQDKAQPQGERARDALLTYLGFAGLGYAPDGTTVAAAQPPTVPLVILSRLVEVNGRPVAVIFCGAAAARLSSVSGTRIELDAALLDESVNAWEARTGVVYPLLYTSTAPALRDAFIALARGARNGAVGVWAQDCSSRFSVADLAAVGPSGTLILPKLFRRVVDYLQQRASVTESLPSWLAAAALRQDDQVLLPTGETVALHTLLSQDGTTVTLHQDILDLVFVER